MPTKPYNLPGPFGEYGALSSDERGMTYTPMSHTFRTLKRYRGGLTSGIWLLDLEAKSVQNITEPDTVDDHPTWYGNILYFLSDRGMNLRPSSNEVYSLELPD